MSFILSIKDKIYQVLIVGLFSYCMYLYVCNNSLENDNNILVSNNLILNQAIVTQKESISVLEKTITDNNSLISDITSKNNYSNKLLSESIAEINELRIMENKRAIENPFMAGNVASDMLSKRLSAITSTEDRSTN